METELLNILLNYFSAKSIKIETTNVISLDIEDKIYGKQSDCHKKVIMAKMDLEDSEYNEINGLFTGVKYNPPTPSSKEFCNVSFSCKIKIPISKRVSRKSLLSLLLHK